MTPLERRLLHIALLFGVSAARDALAADKAERAKPGERKLAVLYNGYPSTPQGPWPIAHIRRIR